MNRSYRTPKLLQINTRARMTELAAALGRAVTLDDWPDEDLDQIRRRGFDWVWLLSVWQTGEAARNISRSRPEWRHEFEETLADLSDEDIQGSGFAIYDYRLHRGLGGDEALARLRKRLADRGIRLMLDFVPNHMAPDHPWIDTVPSRFLAGSQEDLLRDPANYFAHGSGADERVFARGRDPYFPGWYDTIQLDYSRPETVAAMADELKRIATQCDGVRCDMAMLILPEVFERTWGRPALPFWQETIASVKADHPEFCFLAEVYWDMEWTLQQLGFDYCYDKRLYDRLRDGHVQGVRDHFLGTPEYQSKLARFLENHDEQRAAVVFGDLRQRAAALLTYLSPGLKFFHDGQLEGRRKRISPHLVRRPQEPVNQDLLQFYERLLDVLDHPVARNGDWQLLNVRPTTAGSSTSENIIAFKLSQQESPSWIVVVNLADVVSEALVEVDEAIPINRRWTMLDGRGLHPEYSVDADGLSIRMAEFATAILITGQ